MPRSIRMAAAAVLAVGPLLAMPAYAQSRSGAPTTNKGSEAPAVSDQKLDAAAMAITRVNTLSKSYQQKIVQAPPTDREKIAEEADAALEKAVNDSGLSVEEYNNIIEIAQNDPVTQSKILQRLQGMPDQE
jgi:hypothetical protein